jgi:hypothetical protein
MPRKRKPSADFAPEREESAPIGHNEPPLAAPPFGAEAEDWTAWMTHVFAGLAGRLITLLASFERFQAAYPLARPVGDNPPAGIEKWNDDIQGRAGDLKQKLAAVVKQAESLHALEKAPILTAAQAVDGFKKGFLARILALDSRGRLLPANLASAPLNVIAERQTIYATWVDVERRREAARIAADAKRRVEEAAAEASRTMAPEALQLTADALQELEAAEATWTAPSVDLTRTHGPMGSVGSLRTTWRFVPEESDLMALAVAVVAGDAPLTYLAFNESRIGIAVRSEKLRECPGLVIKEEKAYR